MTRKSKRGEARQGLRDMPDARTEEQRRLDALRQLAQEGNAAPEGDSTRSASSLTSLLQGVGGRGHAWPHVRRWRNWLTVFVIVAVVGAVIASVLAQSRTASGVRHASAPPLEIFPASAQIACPTDVTWSPDQRFISVLGYATACPSPDTVYGSGFADVTSALYQGPRSHTDVGYVAIYDTHHGARVVAFSLDSAILQSIHQQALIAPSFTAWLGNAGISPDQYLAINYTHVLWAAGQQRILVTFTCYIPDGPPIPTTAGQTMPGHIVQGVAIVDSTGRHPHVMLHTAGSLMAGTDVWDLSTAQVVATMPASAPFTLQPAALSYTWWSNGALIAHSPLTSGVPPTMTGLGPVGAPRSGSSSFTVWQPGLVATSISSQHVGEQSLHGVAAFTTSVAALSPDGRYLATSLGLAGLLGAAPSNSTSAASTGAVSSDLLTQYGWQSAPRLPLRDAGLRHALTLAEQSGFPSAFGGTLSNIAVVAWRPDGQVIAVSANTPDHAVTLYDCTSGKQIQTLTPPSVTANSANAESSLIEWSPDGRQIAFYDALSGVLTLWNKTSLLT